MASSRAYDIAFRLNGKLNKSYNNAFATAENIASKTADRIITRMAQIGSMVISVQGLQDFTNTYKDFEAEMYRAANAGGIDVQSEAYNNLRDAALEAGAATTKSAYESAQALKYMQQAGWSDEKSAQSLMPVLRLAEATEGELGTVASGVTDSMNALSSSSGSIESYLDKVAKANSIANQTSLELMEGLAEAGSMINAYNIPLSEGIAGLSVLANINKKGSEGGEALSSIIINLTKKSGESYNAMQALGLSAFDETGNFKGFKNTLYELWEATRGLSEEERNVYLQMIGGKTRTSETLALLNSVADSVTNTATGFNYLQTEVDNASGSLDKMANVTNSSMAAKIELVSSAWEDLQIRMVDLFAPKMTAGFENFAGKINDVTEGARRYVNLTESGVTTAAKLYEYGKDFFNFIKNNKDTILTVISGVASGLVATKAADIGGKGIENIGKLFSFVSSNPVLTGLTVGATAIGAIAYNIAATKKELSDASLEKHFGNISLSMDEIEELAESVFFNVGKWRTFNSKLEEADGYYNSMLDNLTEIEKYNYKISLGISLDEGEVSDYASQVQDFIGNVESTLETHQYAVKVGIELLSGADSPISQIANTYFSNLGIEFQNYGKELSGLLSNAIADNFLSEDEINQMMAKMQEMQERLEKVTQRKIEAKYDAINLKYSGAELDYDSYAQMVNELQQVADEQIASAAEAYGLEVGMLEDSYNSGQISSQEYEDALKQAENDYVYRISEIQNKVGSYATNTMLSAYSDEQAAWWAAVQKHFDVDMESLEAEAVSRHIPIERLLASEYSDSFSLRELRNSMPEGMKEAYETIWKETGSALFDNNIANAKQYYDMGQEIPQMIIDNIRQGLITGAGAGDQESFKLLMYGELLGYDEAVKYYIKNGINTFGEDLENNIVAKLSDIQPKIETRFSTLAESAVTKAINTALLKLQEKAPQLQAALSNIFFIKPKVDTSELEGSTFYKLTTGTFPGFASGTTSTPDTFIAGEEGPELITNSPGYRVYDALSTGRIFDNVATAWQNWTAVRDSNNTVSVRRNAVGVAAVGGGGGYNITVNMPAVTINGNADSATAANFKALLESYKAEMTKEIMNQIKAAEARKRRLSNE